MVEAVDFVPASMRLLSASVLLFLEMRKKTSLAKAMWLEDIWHGTTSPRAIHLTQT